MRAGSVAWIASVTDIELTLLAAKPLSLPSFRVNSAAATRTTSHSAATDEQESVLCRLPEAIDRASVARHAG